MDSKTKSIVLKSIIIIAVVCVIILISFSIVFLHGCKEKSQKELIISSGNNKIYYEKFDVSEEYARTPEEKAGIFKQLIDTQKALVQVNSNGKISVDLGNMSIPNKVTFYNHYIYYEDGRDKYGEPSVMELEVNSNTFQFERGISTSEFLESNAEGIKYNGLIIRLDYKDSIIEYYFVVESNIITPENTSGMN